MCARTVQVAAPPGEVVSNTGEQNRKVLAAPVMGASASAAGATTLLRQKHGNCLYPSTFLHSFFLSFVRWPLYSLLRYTGEKEYPKLIDKEQLIAANEKRSNKPQLPKKTEAQKVLRRLCGTPPSEQVEQSVTDLLNGLANCPDRIRHQRSPTPVTYSKTQEALDNALEQQPIDEDTSKTLILQLAAEQYAALGDEEYETNRLRRLFSAFGCVAELNADLLKNTVSEVLVTHQNVKLRLKNSQIIERSDLQ